MANTNFRYSHPFNTPFRGVPARAEWGGEKGSMTKYWSVFGLGIQNCLAYRANYLARALFGLVPLLAMLYLWRTIFEAQRSGGATVAGYSLAQMISYYLIAQLVDALTAVNEDDWQIAADIRDGLISQFLLKPVDYLWYRCSLFLAGRVAYTAIAGPALGLFFLWMHRYVILPQNGQLLGLFVLSLALTAMLQFLISYALAMLAFWVLEVSTFIFIAYAFEYLASGHLFPLDILPPTLQRVLEWTPFPYQLYFPISLYMGRVGEAEAWRGLLIQAGWVMIAYGAARFMWYRGVRRYEAVGG